MTVPYIQAMPSNAEEGGVHQLHLNLRKVVRCADLSSSDPKTQSKALHRTESLLFDVLGFLLFFRGRLGFPSPNLPEPHSLIFSPLRPSRPSPGPPESFSVEQQKGPVRRSRCDGPHLPPKPGWNP